MAPTPVTHPFEHRPATVPVDPARIEARRRAMLAHPSAQPAVTVRASSTVAASAKLDPHPAHQADGPSGEAGSMTTEYGLLVVVGATITSLVIKWASGGAIFELLGGILAAARGLVGA